MTASSDPIGAEHSRTARGLVRRGGGILLAVLLIASTAAVASAASAVPAVASVGGVGGTAATVDQCDRTAGEAVAAQNRSRALLRELRTFADESPVVDDEAVTSVKFHFGRGESHFRNSRYCAAIEKYRTAGDSARAELRRAYRIEARLLLNATAAHLADTGGTGGDASTLRPRLDDTRERLATADSLRTTRSAYRQARDLHATVADRSLPLRVRLARNLLPSMAGGGLALVLLGGIVGAVARSRQSGRRLEWNR
jgi:hypothetical protein